MSYDLVALSGAASLDPDEAADIYARLCDGEAWDDLLQPDPNVEAFVRDITRRWPQLDDVPPDEVENSPWSVPFELSPGHVISAMQWSRAADVAPLFIETALRYRLSVFDPQEEVLHAPGKAPHHTSPRKPAARVCARCGKPIGESELTAELPETPGVYHLQCMLSGWPPSSKN